MTEPANRSTESATLPRNLATGNRRLDGKSRMCPGKQAIPSTGPAKSRSVGKIGTGSGPGANRHFRGGLTPCEPRTERVFWTGGVSALRAGLYARVSTHDQQTPPMWLSTMRDYAKRRTWTVAVEIQDVGSGATTRLERQKLIEAGGVAARQVGAVLGGSRDHPAGIDGTGRGICLLERGPGHDDAERPSTRRYAGRVRENGGRMGGPDRGEAQPREEASSQGRAEQTRHRQGTGDPPDLRDSASSVNEAILRSTPNKAHPRVPGPADAAHRRLRRRDSADRRVMPRSAIMIP